MFDIYLKGNPPTRDTGSRRKAAKAAHQMLDPALDQDRAGLGSHPATEGLSSLQPVLTDPLGGEGAPRSRGDVTPGSHPDLLNTRQWGGAERAK